MAFNKSKYDIAYMRENTERIEIRPNNKLHLSERIQAQIDRGNAKSRHDFIITATLEKLEKLESQD